MTLVAIHAVVDISTNALVVMIGLGLGMAVRAGKDRVVVGVRMTSRTVSFRSTVVHIPPGMVELGIGPDVSVVAGLTGSREARPDMVGVGGRIVVGGMAREAISVRNVVVIVDVAIGAGARRHRVRSRESPSGL